MLSNLTPFTCLLTYLTSPVKAEAIFSICRYNLSIDPSNPDVSAFTGTSTGCSAFFLLASTAGSMYFFLV